MFYIFKFIFGIILFSNFASSSNAKKIASRLSDNVNDTIIELFNNCQCVIYFQCEAFNKFVVLKAGFKQPINCTNENFICCNNKISTEVPENPVESTEVSVTTTTEKNNVEPLIKNVDVVGIKCGIPKTTLNGRILTPETDSATTIAGEVPWMVGIFQKQNINGIPYRFKCAGSLIHPKVVLTGTHCVKSSPIESLRVVATGLEVFQNIGAQPDNERTVLRTIKHPEYYSGGLHNDIALIILQEPYDYSKSSINSICLPKNNQNFDGKKCLAVGWGENGNLSSVPLRKVDVPIVASEQCQKLLRKTRLGNEFELHSSFLCAGGEAGKDTCNGDGGSPLMCLGDDYRFVQVGIVSWGVNCGVVNEPGVYANVAKFREWIDQKLTENQIALGE